MQLFRINTVLNSLICLFIMIDRYNLDKIVNVDCVPCIFGKEFGRKPCWSERALTPTSNRVKMLLKISICVENDFFFVRNIDHMIIK